MGNTGIQTRADHADTRSVRTSPGHRFARPPPPQGGGGSDGAHPTETLAGGTPAPLGGGGSGADEGILPIGGGFGPLQGIEAPLSCCQINQYLDRLGEPDIVPALEHRCLEPPG